MQSMLREQLLPRLAELGNVQLWQHMAECLAAFERELAPLRGVPRAAAEPLDGALELWAPASCLSTLTSQPVGVACYHAALENSACI